jgi:putative hemin transport protein
MSIESARTTNAATDDLRARWARLREEQPHLRQRDAAPALGVSEGELVASELGARAASLRPDWIAILQALEAVGPVLALTRNPHAVIECVGTYHGVESFGPMGQVVGKEIDLRLFLRRWHAGFVFQAPTAASDSRPSLQFFDRHGTALHKVFVSDESNRAAFDALVSQFTSSEPAPAFERAGADAVQPARPDTEIDRAALLSGWEQLKDTHEFTHLLHRLGATRTQAFRLAGAPWAERVELGSWRHVLEGAIPAELPVMTFVGSPGVIQIHTGAIRKIKVVGEWFNIMQPGYNLHLYEPGVSEAWLVRKPTDTGMVHSLELYAADGQTVALLFCKRKEGEPESEAWRELLSKLVRV